MQQSCYVRTIKVIEKIGLTEFCTKLCIKVFATFFIDFRHRKNFPNKDLIETVSCLPKLPAPGTVSAHAHPTFDVLIKSI